jgi:ribosomal protein S12 methylthiotransferase accessory factor
MMSTALAPLRELVDPRVGVVRRISRIDRGATEPLPPVFYLAVLSHFDFRKAKPHERIGVGKALQEEDAVNGAIAEALERYCASQPDTRRIRRFAWSDRRGEGITPPDCVLYSDSQYATGRLPYRRWAEDIEVSWLQGHEFPGEQPVWIPASLIYLNYPGNDADTYFCQPTSNGLAGGASLEAAILAGLYELIERDSFLITWMNRLQVAEIGVPAPALVETSFIRHYRRFEIETRVFRLPTDMPVYVMMAVLLDRRGKRPAAVVGLGCHNDPHIAVRKALFEAAQIHPGEVERCADPRYSERFHSYQDVRTLEDHGAFFASPARLPELAFLLDTSTTQGLEQLPKLGAPTMCEDLERCVTALRGAGCRVVYADITTPDLDGYAIRIVRTIATGLQPIQFGYGQERLGGRRLYEIPRILGYANASTIEATINRCPHPLP